MEDLGAILILILTLLCACLDSGPHMAALFLLKLVVLTLGVGQTLWGTA